MYPKCSAECPAGGGGGGGGGTGVRGNDAIHRPREVRAGGCGEQAVRLSLVHPLSHTKLD
jgi:hypothetical protein